MNEHPSPESEPLDPGSARAGIEPPPPLEEAVMASLRQRGLLEGRRARARRLPWAGALVAIALAAGLWVSLRPHRPGRDAGPGYLLLLYEDATYEPPAAGGEAARVREYADWAKELAREGRLVDARELGESGTLLGAGKSSTLAVPRSDVGVVAGYFVITAASAAEASRIAQDCPHLRHHGSVSVRPLVGGE